MRKAFFFDLDGTLLKAPEEDFFETLSELGFSYPLEEVYQAYTQARRWYRESSHAYRTGEELWRGFADQVLLRLNLGDHPLALIDEIRAGMDRREKVRLYPETKGVLIQLKDKKKYLGLISSRPLEGVERKLEHFELKHFFSLIIGRESVREIKPSPLPFVLALKESGFEVDEVVYVGDCPEEDLAGAQTLGIRVYIVDRRGRFPPTPYLIKDLKELLLKEDLT